MPTADVASKPPPEGHSRVGPGLRLQILLALGGVILIAYVPLFFAIAQVTRARSLADREDSARTLGRALASHVGDVRADRELLAGRLVSHIGEGGAAAIAVYDREGGVEASAGPRAEIESLRAPRRPYGEAATRISTPKGARALDIILPVDDHAVLVRVLTDEASGSSSRMVRGIALYMGVFALALLVFAYIVLTRAIVKPIELLSRAADRVAHGARSLEVPARGAREIAELGASVRSMASRLLDDERRLRAKVDELTTTTRRLGETREQLAGSERMASIGRLAAGVAHEIGNPIAAIMGLHDLLEDAETPEETRTDFLRRMRKETERINVVVRDLLDYARPESGPPSGRIKVANVAEVVSNTLALVRPQKEWKDVDVHVDIGDNVNVLLSAQRLTQVLLNLLMNSAAALADAPANGRRLAVRAASAATGEGGEGVVRIEVEDTGPGIPPDMRESIFDPFVTTKDVGAGTGLGLAVCRGIVEGAAGRIYVDAHYTQGARIVVELRGASPAGTEAPS